MNARVMGNWLATVKGNYFATIANEHAMLFLSVQGDQLEEMNSLQSKDRQPFKPSTLRQDYQIMLKL